MEEYFEEEFKGEVIEGKVIGKVIYEDCHFKNCQFVGVTFQETIFRECTFQDCVWSLIKLNATRMQGVYFIDSKIMGTSFSQIHPLSPSIRFTGSKLELCNFVGLELKDFTLSESIATECAFWSCNLDEADFSKSQLQGVAFEDCSLKKADFRGAKGYELNPWENRVKGAKFSQPDVIGLLKGLSIDID